MQHFIQPPGCRFTAFTCLSSAPTIHAQLQNWQHISYSSCSTVKCLSANPGFSMTLSSTNGRLQTDSPNGYKYTHSSMFTAHGKATAWCPVCHLDGDNHSYDCPRFTFIQPSLQSSSLPYSGPFYPLPLNSSSSIPRSSSTNTPHIPPAKHSKPDHCIPFNKNKGSCPCGADCRFIHKYARCQGGRSTLSHPAPTSLLETSLHMNYSFAACITSFIKIQLPHYHLSMTTLVLWSSSTLSHMTRLINHTYNHLLLLIHKLPQTWCK